MNFNVSRFPAYAGPVYTSVKRKEVLFEDPTVTDIENNIADFIAKKSKAAMENRNGYCCGYFNFKNV